MITSPEPLLRVDHAGKTFAGRRPLETLRDVTLHVDAGEFVSLVGPSGCGKSTLFSLIAGVEPLTTGRIAVNGATEPDKRRLVLYDQLNPAYAHYYTEKEARALLEEGGFEEVRLYHRHGYSWSVVGRRPEAPA